MYILFNVLIIIECSFDCLDTARHAWIRPVQHLAIASATSG